MSREPSLLEQIAAVARRSAMDTYRQRALLIFPMLFPVSYTHLTLPTTERV